MTHTAPPQHPQHLPPKKRARTLPTIHEVVDETTEATSTLPAPTLTRHVTWQDKTHPEKGIEMGPHQEQVMPPEEEYDEDEATQMEEEEGTQDAQEQHEQEEDGTQDAQEQDKDTQDTQDVDDPMDTDDTIATPTATTLSLPRPTVIVLPPFSPDSAYKATLLSPDILARARLPVVAPAPAVAAPVVAPAPAPVAPAPAPVAPAPAPVVPVPAPAPAPTPPADPHIVPTVTILFYSNLRLRGAIQHTHSHHPQTADDLVHDGGAFGQYYDVEDGLPEYRLAVVPVASPDDSATRRTAAAQHVPTWVNHHHNLQREWLPEAVQGNATTWWDYAASAQQQLEVHVFTPQPRPVTLRYRTYDIRNRLLQFDSGRILHKNASWVGTRYVCVFYNKDLNYKGSTLCERSTRLSQQHPTPTQWVATAPNTETLQYVRREFEREMDRTIFPEERVRGTSSSTKYGRRRGTFISFGVTQSRGNRKSRGTRGLHTRKQTNDNNRKYAALYTALCRYTDLLKPGLFGTDDDSKYHACILAKNSQCEWHMDADNLGGCAMMGMGKYGGGELMMGVVS